MDNQDNDGHHESSPSGSDNPDDSINHAKPSGALLDTGRKTASHLAGNNHDTISIPCHHIRLGDFIMLQDRPCQVIRISTSADTGQYRYLGVDLFTKQLWEETSFISNAAPGVDGQSMLGPVFKQYRLWNVDKGQITALTETGDMKQGLPVLDQSDLYSRLEQAFESGRGSIRVIVIEHHDRQLVVNMKVIHESLSADSELDKAFQQAVRENNRANVEEALIVGPNINVLDNQKRTALFTALECHNSEMVKLLLTRGIDLKVTDNSGRTVLDVSVADPGHYLTTFTLLENGAQPTENLDNRITELLLAAAEGWTKKVESLVGPEVDSCDRLGYTALHKAAYFGRYETAKMLILKGADVNRTIAHGGATVLHTVVQRGREHREFFKEHRRVIPPLTRDHVRVVALLLQHNADTKCRRLQDNRTMQELVTEELKLVRNSRTTERSHLQKILILLNAALPLEATAGGLTWPRVSSVGDSANTKLKESQLQIHYLAPGGNYAPFQVSVGNMMRDPIIDNGERGSISEWVKNEANNLELEGYWRWVHLPANNKTWAESTITQLSGMDNQASKIYRSGVESFTNESYHEVRGPAQHARFRQPSFTTLPVSRGGIFSLVIPYFDSENLECFLKKRNCPSDSCKHNFQNQETSKKLYQTPDSPASFHAPLTLDQSYYLSLSNSQRRDEDQVVIKHVDRLEKTALLTRNAHSKRLLMVNQIWVWKIDDMTLITAFPDRRHPHETNLSQQISENFRNSPPLRRDFIMSRLLRHVTGFVDAPTNAGLCENVFHIFEQSIAYREEADCYAAFNYLQKVLSTLDEQKISKEDSEARDKKKKTIEADLCNITKELNHLCEIKDIKDELKMIRKVLEDQKAVIEQYATCRKEPNSIIEESEEDERLSETMSALMKRIFKIGALFTGASTVENSLNHLLDLKQKQGSLIVVRDTRRLANEADRRNRDSAWQSKLLFMFTIVTVAFTPISFISTFMAVPTQEFPHANGEQVSWRWWQVFAASTIAEVLTVAVIAPWVEWNRFIPSRTKHDTQKGEDNEVEKEERSQTLGV